MRVIAPHDWRGFLAWNTASGNLEPVFDALIHDANEAMDITACIKLYPGEEGRNRGMVNEITGWLITQSLGIPQPVAAYIVRVPLGELKSPLPDWLRQLKKNRVKSYWAFGTAKLPATSAALQFTRSDLPLLVEDVKRWEHLPNAVALDEHIANTDRHMNNLIRLGKANYSLIDNGRLAVEAGEKNWSTSHLKAGQHFSNLLSQHCWNDDPTSFNASVTINAGSQHVDALASVRLELEDWWRRLIRNDAERDAFDNFITARANALSILLSQRYRLLAL